MLKQWGVSFTLSDHSPPSTPRLTHILTEMLQNWSLTLTQWFSKCEVWLPEPAASAAPENMLEMQTLRPQSRPAESETRNVRPSDLSVSEPPRGL